MAATFPQLLDLFIGDAEEPGVYQPGLVAVICDQLEPPPQTFLTVCEAIFPALTEKGPRTVDSYMERAGEQAVVAIRDGYDLWRKQRGELVKAAA